MHSPLGLTAQPVAVLHLLLRDAAEDGAPLHLPLRRVAPTVAHEQGGFWQSSASLIIGASGFLCSENVR